MTSTLSVSTGDWLNAPTSYSYQAMSNDGPLGGSPTNSSTYTSVPSDAGKGVFFRVTATNSLGTGSADSNTVAIPTPPAVTRYIGPGGTGDGTSQATPASFGNLNAMIQAVGPGGFVRILPGTYAGKYQTINHGGDATGPVTITGVDGQAAPTISLSGTDLGAYIFQCQDGANYLRWTGINVRSCGLAAWKINGQVNNWEIDHIVAGDTRGLVYMVLPANPNSQEHPSLDYFNFHDITITGWSRGQLSFYNAHHGTIQNVTGDSQLRNEDPISVLCSFDGDSNDVDVIGCTSKNAFDDRGAGFTGSISGGVLTVTAVKNGTISSGQTIFDANGVSYGSVTSQVTPLASGESTGKVGRYNLAAGSTAASSTSFHGGNPKLYWNGDGFSTEGGTYDIRFTNCQVDTTVDGGFDLKGGTSDKPHRVVNGSVTNVKRGIRVGNTGGSVTHVNIDGLRIGNIVLVPNPDGVSQSPSAGGRAEVWIEQGSYLNYRANSITDANGVVPQSSFEIDGGTATITTY